MKKISIIIISLFCYLNAMSQDIPLNELVNINLPKGAEKMVKARHLPRTTIDTTGEASEFEYGTGIGDFYKLNGIIIRLHGGRGNAPENYLEQLMKGSKGMYLTVDGHLPPHYAASIKPVNNYKVYIETYANQKYSYYRFFALSNTQSSLLNGTIEFQEAQRDKVERILDELLKSITFK